MSEGSDDLPYLFGDLEVADSQATGYQIAAPFPHTVLDNFLPQAHAKFLSDTFPDPKHPVWLDWKTRHPAQYGKLGPGDGSNFRLLPAHFRLALQEFNGSNFLRFLEKLTGIQKLLPDPYFTGGGMHQIVKGGILDVHTDFNFYARLNLYRRINVLVYLTLDWREGYGGELELWSGAPRDGGKCARRIEPLYNRCVVFQTDKRSFHGHPNEWQAPDGITRRSLAFYYYTAEPALGSQYDEITDFQGVAEKALPGG